MPVHCTGHHHHQLGFFSTPTPILLILIYTLIKNRVGYDGVPAILEYRPSDLYLTDRKETMAILQKGTHTPLHICK